MMNQYRKRQLAVSGLAAVVSLAPLALEGCAGFVQFAEPNKNIARWEGDLQKGENNTYTPRLKNVTDDSKIEITAKARTHRGASIPVNFVQNGRQIIFEDNSNVFQSGDEYDVALSLKQNNVVVDTDTFEFQYFSGFSTPELYSQFNTQITNLQNTIDTIVVEGNFNVNGYGNSNSNSSINGSNNNGNAQGNENKNYNNNSPANENKNNNSGQENGNDNGIQNGNGNNNEGNSNGNGNQNKNNNSGQENGNDNGILNGNDNGNPQKSQLERVTEYSLANLPRSQDDPNTRGNEGLDILIYNVSPSGYSFAYKLKQEISHNDDRWPLLSYELQSGNTNGSFWVAVGGNGLNNTTVSTNIGGVSTDYLVVINGDEKNSDSAQDIPSGDFSLKETGADKTTGQTIRYTENVRAK